MTTLQDTIREYEEGTAMLRSRIGELNEEISRERTRSAEADVRELEGRRYQLYVEQAHMEQAIEEMLDYLAEVENPGAERARSAKRKTYA